MILIAQCYASLLSGTGVFAAASSGTDPLTWIAVIALLLLIPLGLWYIMNPRSAALHGQRWKYKDDLEPSDSLLFWTRFSGIVMLLGGIVGLVVVFSFLTTQ